MQLILKNVMNDFYLRDTSSKIKAVRLFTFNSGDFETLAAAFPAKRL